MTKKALAIIPCYNEEASIASVVQAVQNSVQDCDVLVVSDGSNDNSVACAKKAGAMVLDLPCNLGIGGAMQAGYQFANRKGYHCAVQVDGDGQHPAAEIPKLLSAIDSGSADLVVGSRYIEGRLKGRVSSVSRVMGGTLLSCWLTLLCGKSVSDPTSGFRAANRKVLELFSQQYPSDYPEPVSLLMLIKRSYRVSEVSVSMRQRVGGSSSIKSFHSLLYMMKVMWRMALEKAFR